MRLTHKDSKIAEVTAGQLSELNNNDIVVYQVEYVREDERIERSFSQVSRSTWSVYLIEYRSAI